MTLFKRGDRVVYEPTGQTIHTPRLIGKTGTVIAHTGATHYVDIDWDAPDPVWHIMAKNLRPLVTGITSHNGWSEDGPV